MYIRVKRSGEKGYEYLQLVRSYRKEGKVRQQVMVTLGRRDTLVGTGTLDRLLKSLGKFSQRLKVVETVKREGLCSPGKPRVRDPV